MDLLEMRERVRRDLKDEDQARYRFSNNEIDRAIQRAVNEFSKHAPRELKTTFETSPGSRSLDISTLTERIIVDAVEYPIGRHPKVFRVFRLYQDHLTIGEPIDPSIPDSVPDGSVCAVYWGKRHTLDSDTSTIPSHYEDLIALGACAYLIISRSQYATDKVTVGGEMVDRDYLRWGRGSLRQFQEELKRISLTRRLKVSRFY